MRIKSTIHRKMFKFFTDNIAICGRKSIHNSRWADRQTALDIPKWVHKRFEDIRRSNRARALFHSIFLFSIASILPVELCYSNGKSIDSMLNKKRPVVLTFNGKLKLRYLSRDIWVVSRNREVPDLNFFPGNVDFFAKNIFEKFRKIWSKNIYLKNSEKFNQTKTFFC